MNLMHPDVAARAVRFTPPQSKSLELPPHALEPLERRTLLASAVAAGAFDLTNVPAFTPTSSNLADVKHGPMAVAGGHLANLYLDYRRAIKAGRDYTATNQA